MQFMNSLKPIALLIFILLYQCAVGQTINRMFSSGWADTWWTFAFKIDGTYERISNGHYGNTIVRGHYKMKEDTIELLTGFKKTSKTVNPLYLLDKEGFLIDIWLRYDYAPYNPKIGEPIIIGPSRIRNIKFPQVPSLDSNLKVGLNQMLTYALGLDTVGKIFARHNISRKIAIENYYQLNDTTFDPVQTGEVMLNFAPSKDIDRSNYLEIEDINMNPDETSMRIKIHSNKKVVEIWFDFINENGNWHFERLTTFGFY
jgi:hypothetical protein